jgi:hypothetical protein
LSSTTPLSSPGPGGVPQSQAANEKSKPKAKTPNGLAARVRRNTFIDVPRVHAQREDVPHYSIGWIWPYDPIRASVI